MLEIFERFTLRIDDTLTGAAGRVFEALSDEAVPFLTLLIAVTLAFYVFRMATRGSLDLVGMVYFVARSALVYMVVAGGVLWADVLYPFIIGFGENVGLTVYRAFGGPLLLPEEGFGSILDAYWTGVTDASRRLFDQIEGSTLGVSGAEVVGALVGVMTNLFGIVMLVLAFAILTIAKMLLIVFLAVAPLFLVFGYVGATKTVFEGWVSGVTRVLITIVLVYTVLGLFTAASEVLLAEANAAAEAAEGEADANRFILTQMWQLCFISLMGIAMLFMVPGTAIGMAGGAISIGASTAAFATGAMAIAAQQAGTQLGMATGAAARGTAQAVRDGITAGPASTSAAAGAARGTVLDEGATVRERVRRNLARGDSWRGPGARKG